MRPRPWERWLGPLCGIAFVLFALLTALVLAGDLRSMDVALAQRVQGVSWGPLAPLMRATSAIGTLGPIQALVGVAVVLGALLWDWRAALLLALAGLASVVNLALRLSLQRDGPPTGVGAALDSTRSHSYPSGHAVLFTWASVMAAALISARVRQPWRTAVWVGAVAVIAVACVGRVWVGAHWPSDVVGGVLLGAGWSALVLWLPGRWLRRL